MTCFCLLVHVQASCLLYDTWNLNLLILFYFTSIIPTLFLQTKDFWREAQILSKVHHPNVVAFYGVVPDGTGGTLATVAEFMVNGSLRNVLMRKDR